MESDHWIFSDEATEHLHRVMRLADSGNTSLQTIKKLRKTLPADKVTLIMDLFGLRTKAHSKFSKAKQMYFTRIQLEQSTSEIIAKYKAKRFSEFDHTADLCCGIGGDAIGLAQVSHLQVIETDPLILEMARRNIQVYEGDCETVNGKAESFDVGGVDAFHLDPDRRLRENPSEPSRTIQPDFFSPDLEQIKKLEQLNPNFGIKLAPASPSWPGEYEVEFIGHQRECKQQVLWSGKLTQSFGITVTVLNNSGTESESIHCCREEIKSYSTQYTETVAVSNYLYDPHSALLASQLLPFFATKLDLGLVDASSRYLTSNNLVDSPLMSGFEVLEIAKPDPVQIKNYLKAQKSGTPEIKKRDRRDDLYEKLSRIRLRGDHTLTIILSNTIEGYRAILCRRVSN